MTANSGWLGGDQANGGRRSLIGMVNVRALPGTPRHELSMQSIIEKAVEEARSLAEAGFHTLILENMHDAPYLKGGAVGPEVCAAMSAVAVAVRQALPEIPVGIQILGGANEMALAVAHATGLQFIRAEGFVFSAISDEGLIADAAAGPLLRYRRMIGADGPGGVRILADIKKKHSSHAITADVDLAETARAADFFGADGLIVTGVATGRETNPDDLREVRSATPHLPLLVGSGVTPANAAALLEYADGLIVGSSLKVDGVWSNELDPKRIEALTKAAPGSA